MNYLTTRINALLERLAPLKQSDEYSFDYIHALIAYAVILTAHYRLHIDLFLTCTLLLVIVLIIEFWYDAHYEKNQTFLINLRDTLDYVAGLIVALAVILL